MEYNFTDIEKWVKDKWAKDKVYEVTNDTNKPKCYILDMFPYPSGAGLHVGHPLGYIGSDIYARYKRLCGYNVLHPMGFDAFGLPAEQYAIETGQHPAVTTEKNIARYREQLDNIGFCFDWSREVRTSDPKYYKWTQWIFLQLFHSWYDRKQNKARPISELIAIFEEEGNKNCSCPGDESLQFDGERWKDFSEKEQRDVLMQYRIAYQGYAQVWWCEALGTVLANDEVVNGVSERGGFPVERKNMRQWFLRITEYAERLLTSLDTLEWSDAMKEMQKNWIGKSVGAEVRFDLSPALSEGEGGVTQAHGEKLRGEKPGWNTAEPSLYNLIGAFREDLKNNSTDAESILWLQLKAKRLGVKFRRQHVIGRFIADFVCLPARLIIEVDGKIHEQQKEADAERTTYLNEKGFRVIRFTNEEVVASIESVIEEIKKQIKVTSQAGNEVRNISLSFGEGRGEVFVFTTRPDTIFGVDFMVLAPEHELVNAITTIEQRGAIDKYVQYVKSRSERERMTDVKQVTGCFTGAYAIHPLTGKQMPVWISEYVLVNYGTGAIMAVPSGDERDHAFAKHFNIPITNIFENRYTGENAYSDKAGTIENGDFLSGMSIAEATEAAINELEDIGAGKRKVNYRLRDAGFSRQRYWGEPFPIMYVDDIPYGIDELPFKNTELNKLPVELPYVESYGPGPEGQGPLANMREWTSPRPSPEMERELSHYSDRSKIDEHVNILSNEKKINIGPTYSVASIKQYENARLNRKNATEAEDILWQNVRGNKLGEKFRRQHPIESYIVDFVCLSKGIVVEVDGGYHETPEQEEYDKDRTRVLEELGFKVVRFTNDMVINQTKDVLITIKKLLLSSAHIIPGSSPIHNANSNIDNTSLSISGAGNISLSISGKADNTSLSISGEGRGEVSRETNTMPGYAGSSWYFLRYMDPYNDHEFAGRKAIDYWQQVDLYVGGTEHAVGHLLYSRMWTKVLHDLGYLGFDEPFRRLLNQGMIQGSSRFIFRVELRASGEKPIDLAIPIFVSCRYNEKYARKEITLKEFGGIVFSQIPRFSNYNKEDISIAGITRLHVDVNIVDGVELDMEAFKKWRPEYANAEFITEEDGKFICAAEIEKMSKSKYNVVNPDDIVAQYGADTFRMNEMFLGPIDISKPWDTKGIEGVHRFLKKMWRLYFGDTGWVVTDEAATDAELRVLHKTIKKISEDIERFSFNTSVSQFMICVNELATLGCHKRAILEPLVVAICPFAPHIAEELWQKLGHTTSVVDASFPKYEEHYVTENTKKYPVAVNGKTRIEMEFPLDAEQAVVEQEVLADATIQKWLEGKSPKKFIYVKGKMINVVV